jgi:superfamily II DNA/RNA helicase
LNMAEYLKKYMPGERLYQHIWNNKGRDSLDFLESIWKEKPESESIIHCSNCSDLDSMDGYLQSYGPGLVSGFAVTGDDWQHLGKYNVENFKGRHAMVLVFQVNL